MAKTFANLQVGVRMYLDEAQQTDFLDSEVEREINYAYHDVVSKVMAVYEDFYLTTTPNTYSTVANQQEYAITTNLLKVNRVEINYNPTDANSEAIRAVAIKMAELPLNVGNTSVAGGLYNAGYYLIGSPTAQKIGFVPIPTNAGTNNISVWGIEAPSDLSADGDNVLIPYADRFCKLIEMKAASELLRKGQQEETYADNCLRNYYAGVIDMQTFLKERQSDGPWMIQDTMFEDTNFEVSLG